ncbi:MAG: YtxH domain-containing protein [Nitrospirota bacterium]|jgi:gas vesicle protein
MSNETQQTSAGSIMFSFLLGGIVGAGLALLLAPHSGPETRRRVTEFSGDVRKRADEAFDQARETVEAAFDKGRGTLQEKREAVTSAIEAGRDAFHKEKTKEAAEG